MSTPFIGLETEGGNPLAAAAVDASPSGAAQGSSWPDSTGGAARSGAEGGVTPEDLAAAVSTFAAEFEHWAGRKAAAAGASVPRLTLLYAVHCHGPQKMATLAEALAVTPRNVTALVDGLEAEGLVRRIPHSTDRRVTLVELTCNSELVEAQFSTYQASIANLFESLTDGDRGTLRRLLKTLHERMTAETGCSTTDGQASDA
jgi:DNA-binding MarR family transcriptional regulator